MTITDAPVEHIDFDWVNMYKQPIKQRLPCAFLLLYHEAMEKGEKYIDYSCPGGRVVGRISPEGHLDYIVNPEPEMVRPEENK